MATSEPTVLTVPRPCGVCGGVLHWVNQGGVCWFTCPTCDFTATAEYELPKPCKRCGREHISDIACPLRPR